MKRCQTLRTLLIILAVLLSDILCAAVAYNYCSLQWAGRYEGASAPPETAFLLAIPYAAGMLLCLCLAAACQRRIRRAGEGGPR